MRFFPSRTKTFGQLLASAAAALALAAPAFAQEPPAADPAPAPAPAPAEPAPAAPAPAEPAPAAPAEPAPDVMPSAGELYGVEEGAVPPGGTMEWAERREIRVIQKRDVVKEGRHAFSLMAGVVPNDDFFTYITGGLSYNYFFSEDLSMFVKGVYAYDQATSLKTTLSSDQGAGGYGLDVRLPQTLMGFASTGVDWNLVHGKLGFFGTRLVEFDAALSFGLGAVATQTTTQSAPDPALRISPAGNLGAYLQFYLGERFALRADYHQLVYPAFDDTTGGTSGVSYPIAVTLGLTWFTAAPN